MEKQWQKTLTIIKEQVSSAIYRTFFSQTICEEEGDRLVVFVPSSFIKEEMVKKYLPIINQSVETVFGKHLEVELKIKSSLSYPKDSKAEPELHFIPTPRLNSNLNPKYTLENFVVGLSNNLAYAAAQAVAANPGTTYNPLFIYGGTGVGKTHLMLGIGNALLKKNPYLKIIYCPLESFTNDLVAGIQSRKMGDFRAKYRACDLLLVDDTQFISGRDSTQEEFFHTFNELQAKNSQVVLTSDRPPGEIQKLEGRLASRFQGGLMVDIQQPDFDTRVAILKAKCKEKREDVPEEILTLIAEKMPTNARELEGKLLQIVQTAKLKGETLNKDTIKVFLGNGISIDKKLDYKKVLSIIYQYFNLKVSDLTGPRRNKELVLPRQLAMYLLHQECRITFEKIGEILGGRDHTTIMHGVEKIKEVAERDREVARMLGEIKESLGN